MCRLDFFAVHTPKKPCDIVSRAVLLSRDTKSICKGLGGTGIGIGIYLGYTLSAEGESLRFIWRNPIDGSWKILLQQVLSECYANCGGVFLCVFSSQQEFVCVLFVRAGV